MRRLAQTRATTFLDTLRTIETLRARIRELEAELERVRALVPVVEDGV